MIGPRASTGGRCLKRYRVRRIIGLLVFIGLLVLIGLLIWWKWATAPVGEVGPTVIVVARGAAIDDIGRQLQQAKLIKSVAAFKLMVMKLGVSKSIQAGDFRLDGKMSLAEVVTGLTHGSLDVWITLPEGWRREQMAQRLAENLSDSFDAGEFIRLSAAEEGYLFPDTYLMPQEASAGAVVKLLTETFRKKVGVIDRDMVILASIVEREAKGEADRKLVAAILLKRLKLNMGLNADASLQFILGGPTDWWPTPKAVDKQLKSPFNTYIYAGLPPAPIANPGLAVITAVRQAQDTPYVYYLHDAEGEIHPAKTLEEHQANIDRYLGY